MTRVNTGRGYRPIRFAGLLYSSILSGGLLLVNGTTPASAAACTATVTVDALNSTSCTGGTSAATLTYVTSNPLYVGGNFTLRLNDHDINSAAGEGITFSGVTAGNDGTVTLETGSNVISGAGGIGITAVGVDSNTTVNVETSSTVTGDVGIFVRTTGAGIGGNVTVNTQVDTAVTGTAGDGIHAQSFGAGNVVVKADGAVTGNIGVDADGIEVFTNAGTVDVTTGTNEIKGNDNGIEVFSNDGTVKVTTGSGKVTGTIGSGINATAFSNNVTVDVKGDVQGTSGITAVSSAGGAVNVTTAGLAPVTIVAGTGGAGINASTTTTGIVTITNNVFVLGSTAGIVAASGTGAIQITNTGVIANASFSDAGLAISTSGGATTIDNNSIGILGRVVTGLSGDTLNNNAIWETEGDSDFSAGGDTVNNDVNGLILAANDEAIAETTRFLNLETLNNSGLIDLSDQNVPNGSNISDTLSTSGNYVGGGGLDVDAFLGGPGSLSDQLIIGGNATGETEIFVIDSNPGTGAFNPTGILVVDVAGTADATNFFLANGPIDKGLFVYDLVFDAATGEFRLVGLPDSDVFETLAAVSSSQEIWRETADAWSTRQENLRDMLAGSQTVTAVADPPVTVSDAPMASLWVSALGSWAERDDDADFANIEFDLSYSQDIYGIVGGADFRTEMGSDSSLLFGLMVGYVDSSLDFDDSDTSIDTDGATLGAYAALMSNGFFATILVKADLLNMDFSTSETDGEDDADVTSIGARGDFGYRFGDTLFVEPMLSVDAISTKIDEFTIAGTDIDAGTNESFRAGAGVRVGYGGETIRASATARIWDVFATDNEVDIISGGAPLGISDDDLEGVYGDVSGQVDVNLSTNTTLYLKGGVLFSDDVTKPNASGGFAFYW